MLPRSFQYFAPTTIEEASRILRERADAKVLAGGMSLIPLMKLRLASPAAIVDINGIPGLDLIQESQDRNSLTLGALTRHHAIETSPLVRSRAPLMSDVAGSIGDPQVRNVGTIGGSLAHSDPSGDWGAALLALRASVTVFGSSGTRTIPIDEFLVDTFTTDLRADELVTQVSVPLPSGAASGGAYAKFERKAGDFATVGVAAQVTLESRGATAKCVSAGVGLTAVGPKSLRASGAEAALVGRTMTKATIEEAARAAAGSCSPTDDPLRGSAAYKREMVGVFTRRALETAVSRAQGRGAARP